MAGLVAVTLADGTVVWTLPAHVAAMTAAGTMMAPLTAADATAALARVRATRGGVVRV